MQCLSCGATLRPTARVCIKCGTLVPLNRPEGADAELIGAPVASQSTAVSTSFEEKIRGSSFSPVADPDDRPKKSESSTATNSSDPKSVVSPPPAFEAAPGFEESPPHIERTHLAADVNARVESRPALGRQKTKIVVVLVAAAFAAGATGLIVSEEFVPTVRDVPAVGGDPASINGELLTDLIRLAGTGSWSAIDQRARNAARLTFDVGDRKAARAQNGRGLEYFSNKQFDLAVAEFEKATRASRNDIEIRNNLGFAELRRGRLDAAQVYLLESLSMDPTRSSAWSNLAEVMAEKDDEERARAALKLTVYFSRNQANTLKFLADGSQLGSQRLRQISEHMRPQLESIPTYIR